MKKLLCFSALVTAILSSCDKPVIDDQVFLSRGITLYFRDSTTGAVLIGRNGQPFNPDSVTIGENVAGLGQNFPSGYAQDHDTAGKYAVHFDYLTQRVHDASNDLNPYAFDKTYFVRFNAAANDTLRFEKTVGAPVVRFSWNGHFITDFRASLPDTSINVLK